MSTSDRPVLLLFDVNETLLDLAPLKAAISAVLPGPDSPVLWFTAMLQHAAMMSLAGRHAPLPQIGSAVLRMLAEGRGIALNEEQAEAALHPLTRLAPHHDVAPGLERLRAAGYRMAALSNSSGAALRAQLSYAGLDRLFDAQYSVEEVGVYKPHPDVYLHAVRAMGTLPGDAMLVAAHGWDVAGAAWAGLRSAFVRRPGQAPFPLAPPPDYLVPDLEALADVLGAEPARIQA